MFPWPHLGGTEATLKLGTRLGKITAMCLWKTKKATNWI